MSNANGLIGKANGSKVAERDWTKIRTEKTSTGHEIEVAPFWPQIAAHTGELVWDVAAGMRGQLLCVIRVSAYRGEVRAAWLAHGKMPPSVVCDTVVSAAQRMLAESALS